MPRCNSQSCSLPTNLDGSSLVLALMPGCLTPSLDMLLRKLQHVFGGHLDT